MPSLCWCRFFGEKMVNPLPDGNEGESLLSAVDRLPNPKSGSLLEVQFRRLLLKCAEQTDVSNTWQRDPKFHLVRA